MSTEIYKYYNPNPDAKPGKHWHRSDCVIRAFACALNRRWTEVYKDLCEIGLKKFDIPLGERVIKEYVKKNGMEQVSLPVYTKLRDFVKKSKGTCICNLRGHMVCVKEGQIWDTWDCSYSTMKTYYTFTKK